MTTSGPNRLAALALAGLVLAGCGGGGSSSTSASPEPTSSAPSTSRSASPTRTPTPAPTTPPAVGTVLTTLPSSGRVTVHVNPAGSGFTVLESVVGQGMVDQSVITTYDRRGRQLATIPTAGFTGECGAMDVTAGGRRLVLAELVTDEPAQGVIAEQWSEDLVAFDAATGHQVWTAPVVPAQDENLGCNGAGYPDEMRSLQVTTDGAYAAFGSYFHQSPVAVELATGALSPRPDLLGTLGTSVVTGVEDSYNPSTYTLTAPPSWAVRGTLSAGHSSENAETVPFVDPASATTLAFSGSGGSSASTGLSDDGSLLFSAQTLGSPGVATVVTAYSLPGMTQLWRNQPDTPTTALGLLGSGGSTLVARRTAGGETTTVGLDTGTGALQWSLPAIDTLCGISSTQMLVSVNSQLAVIDLASGRQLSYTDGAGCPQMFSGGIGVVDGAVTQLLTP